MKVHGHPLHFLLINLVVFFISIQSFSQKVKDIIPTIDCIKYTGNGLYQASFGYENPTNKEVVIDESGSIIKSNNGKRVAKGLNKFQPGKKTKVFTKEFSSNDYVEWTIISNGNEHTIVVNANAAKCEPDDGFIFPVIGNGKSYDLIGQELTAFCDNVAGDTPSDLIFQVNGNKVLVEIIPIAGKFSNVITLLGSLNVDDRDYLLYTNPIPPDTNPIPPAIFLSGLSAIDVYINTDVVCLLNNYPDLINFARPVYPSIKHAFGDGDTGEAVSQGDAVQTSKTVRESFKLIDTEGRVLPVDGTGITIGVMSNSFDTQPYSSGNPSKATLDVLAKDLPGDGNDSYPEPISVLSDYTYGVASDEGRAMMHIIHDVAPGAKLAFHTGSLSPRNFEVGFKALAVDSDIIVDDITFITEPFFGGGKISDAINEFTNAGGIHFTSAGNFGDNAYQSVFNPSANRPSTNFINSAETRAHIFATNTGSEDYLQKISVVPGTYMIALQWKENAASQVNELGAIADLDIYIVDDNGRLLVGSNRVNIAGDPTEVIVFRATGSGEANILITSANGATNVPFRYIAFQSNGLTWEYHTEGTPTVSGHAMTENTVAVGAIRYNKTEPELFSSFGGSLSDGSGVTVDFAAPDGVDTNVNSIGIKYFSNGAPTDETPQFPNFFGTSASAPSAAAAVALLQSALPTWYPDLSNPGKSSKSASDVIGLFKSNVRDGSVENPQAGAGMIDANKVFNSLASQTSRITSFEFVPETDSDSASTSTVKIKIIGDFLPAPTSETENVVYLDGEPVPFTYENGVIYAYIPPFSGNPDLQIYTQPKDGSTGNGGFSEPYKFFQDGKNILTITANPVTVKFGEAYKSKFTYTVEGIELPEDETSYANVLNSLGFPNVIFTTIVDNFDYPDVKNYAIIPSFYGDFADADADGVPDVYDQCPETPQGEAVDSNGCTDTQKGEADFTPATTFKVNFINGNLAVEKNYLSIKPADQEETYGEDIANDFIYQITDAYGVAISQADLELMYEDIDDFYAVISSAHKSDFNPAYTSSLIFNDFKALINDWDWASETNDFKALINTWKALINTWKALINDVDDPTNGSDPNFNMILEGSSWSSTENTFKALINSSDNINLDPSHFTSYSAHLNDFKPLINDFKPLINDFKALINRSEFVGDIYLNDFKPLINDFKPLINDFKALINDSSALFTVVSTDDAPSNEFPDNTISKFYAVNLLTGIHVYEEPHYILPGSLLNAIEANFEITYDPGRLTITPAILTAKTVNKEIEYGKTLTAADLTTDFTGLVNDDLLREVFSNTIPYYFIKLNDDDIEANRIEINQLKERGVYAIKIRTPQNYIIEYNNDVDHGQLTITEATLTVVTTSAPNIKYGSTPVIETVFDGFATGEDVGTLSHGGIPYFFMKQDETPDCDTCTKYYLPYVTGEAKMDVGIYNIFITDDPNDNYTIEFAADRGTLTVDPATLTVTTIPFSVEYGDAVSAVINTTVTGFASPDESVSTVFPGPDDSALIPYLFVKGTDDGLDINTVKALGTYKIEVTAPDSGNYVIAYHADHGGLTINPKELFPVTKYYEADYGAFVSSDLTTEFGFVYGELLSYVYPDGVPYTFVKDGVTYQKTAELEVGIYDIKIDAPVSGNYVINSYGSGHSYLDIMPATLIVTISPEELIVNQGDTPALTTTFDSGNAYEEGVNDVFPAGIPYYYEGKPGTFDDTSVPGVFTVRIEDPTNYEMAYTSDAILFVNPFNDEVKKVRNYSDCVKHNDDRPGTYTVTYRYENDNDYAVFAALGADNNLTGSAAATASGTLPTIFMPGSGTFEIVFNGEQLVWSLTTYEGTHKSSVSSASTAGASECDAKLDGAYKIYPNPFTSDFKIEQITMESSKVDVYNMYGLKVIDGPSFVGDFSTKTIKMGHLPDALYIIRIVSATAVRTFNILKQN